MARSKLSIKSIGALAGVLGLTLVATALRFYRLDAQSLWQDEMWRVLIGYHHSASYVDAAASAALLQGQPPLIYWAMRFLYSLTNWLGVPWNDLWARLPSALFGSMAIPLLFVAARAWFGARVAWLAAALLAISPFAIYYSQELAPYALWTLMTLAVTHQLVRAVQMDRWRAWGWLALLMILAVYAHAFTTVAIALQVTMVGAMALIGYLQRTGRLPVHDPISPPLTQISLTVFFKTSACAALAALAFLPLLPNLASISNQATQSATEQTVGHFVLPLTRFLLQILESYLPYLNGLGLAGSLVMAALVVLGAVLALRSGRLAGVLLALMAVLHLCVLYLMFVIQNYPFFKPRYAIALLPFLLVALSLALWQCLDWVSRARFGRKREAGAHPPWRRYAGWALGVALAATLLAGNVRAMPGAWEVKKQDLRGMTRYLENSLGVQDAVIYQPRGTHEPYAYYFAADYADRPRYRDQWSEGLLRDLYLVSAVLPQLPDIGTAFGIPQEVASSTEVKIYRVRVEQQLPRVPLTNGDWAEATVTDGQLDLPGWTLPEDARVYRELAASETQSNSLRIEYPHGMTNGTLRTERISVTVGSGALVAAELKAENVNPLGIVVGMMVYGDHGALTQFVSDPSRGNHDWLTFTAAGIMPKQAISISVMVMFLGKPQQPATVHVRNVRFYYDQPAATGESAIPKGVMPYELPNGGFEAAAPDGRMIGWNLSKHDKVDVVRDAQVKHSGENALRLTLKGPVNDFIVGSPLLPITATAGATFYFRALVKTEDLPAPSFDTGVCMMMGWFGEGKQLRLDRSLCLAGNNDWKVLSISGQVPAGAKTVQLVPLRLQQCLGPGGTVWLDDVQLYFAAQP